MDFNRIPKPLLVAVVLLIGVALLPFLNEPHSVCQSQLQVLAESQAGFIYPKIEKKVKIPPTYDRAYRSCLNSRVANTAGGCAEYFEIIARLTRDLNSIGNECGEFVAKDEPITKALTQSLRLFVEIAWGDPPQDEKADFRLATSWLEMTDLAVFCSLKDQWIRFFGKESWQIQRQNIQMELSGELKKFETQPDGTKICINCDESRASAVDKFGEDNVKSRSLFNLNCDRFR